MGEKRKSKWTKGKEKMLENIEGNEREVSLLREIRRGKGWVWKVGKCENTGYTCHATGFVMH